MYLQVSYCQGNVTKDQTNHNKAMSKVRPTVKQIFGEIKTYKFADFTSQLKIGMSSDDRLSLVYGILENAKTCLYGKKNR